jgi:hypothetical protein
VASRGEPVRVEGGDPTSVGKTLLSAERAGEQPLLAHDHRLAVPGDLRLEQRFVAVLNLALELGPAAAERSIRFASGATEHLSIVT